MEPRWAYDLHQRIDSLVPPERVDIEPGAGYLNVSRRQIEALLRIAERPTKDQGVQTKRTYPPMVETALSALNNANIVGVSADFTNEHNGPTRATFIFTVVV